MAAKKPTLTAADFSVDGKRIRVSVARELHAAGWRWCPGCASLLALDRFGMADRPRRISGYCRQCHSRAVAAQRKEKSCAR